MSVSCVQMANAALGEGPVWSTREQALYWVDISRPAIFRFDPDSGQNGHWPMPDAVSCLAPRRTGGLVFAAGSGFGTIDLHTGAVTPLAQPEANQPANRFNDGKVDRRGRFWAGTMDKGERQPAGSLYCLLEGGEVRRAESGIICSNGIGWSPDDRIMYFTDSMRRTIWVYDYEAEKGEISNRRVFARLADDDGVPDGLTVDQAGFVWSSVWDGWRIVRYAPDGAVDSEIAMPVQRPTSCAFGGKDLMTLYVTSASIGLSAGDLQRGPLAGGLFALRTKVPGLPSAEFGG